MRQIRFTTTWWDVLRLYLRVQLRRWPIHLLYLALLVIIGLSTYADASDGAPLWAYLTVTIVLGLGFLLGLYLLSACFTVVILLILHFRGGIFCEHALTLTEELLIEETFLCRTEYRWDQVSRLVKTKSCLLAYVVDRGFSRFFLRRAHLIPRRAFADQAEMDAFFEEMKALKAY